MVDFGASVIPRRAPLAVVASMVCAAIAGASCDSSSNGGAGGAQCGEVRPTKNQTCDDCIGAMCGDALSAANDACKGYVSCQDACGCTNTCLASCKARIDASCRDAQEELASCFQKPCEKACMLSSSSSGAGGASSASVSSASTGSFGGAPPF